MKQEDLDYLVSLDTPKEDIEYIDKNNFNFVAIYNSKKECVETEIFYRDEKFFDFSLDCIKLPSGRYLALRNREHLKGVCC